MTAQRARVGRPGARVIEIDEIAILSWFSFSCRATI